jgi:phage anti-repressor protein
VFIKRRKKNQKGEKKMKKEVKKLLAYLVCMVYNNEEGERSRKERIAPAKQSAQEYNVPAGHDDRLGQGSVI